MYYTYILKSERDGSLYTGQCENLQERVERHNKGYTKSTKAKIPWELVYYETYNTRSEAIKRELQIKIYKSRQYISNLVTEPPEGVLKGD